MLGKRKRELEREAARWKERAQELEKRLEEQARQEARKARQWDAVFSYTGQRRADEEERE